MFLFLDKFEEVMSLNGVINSDELYVCGDFNLDILKCNSNNDAQNFLTLCHSHSILLVISEPTRIATLSATLIDHIYTAVPTHITSGIVHCGK